MKFCALILTLSVMTSCTPSGGGKTSVSNDEGPATPALPSPVVNSGTVMNDPLAQYAWHLKNSGQDGFSAGPGTSGQDFNIQTVHASGIKGAGIKIAVSDSGTEVSHPDLVANELKGQHRNYSTNSPSLWRNSSPYENDIDPHGTAVTGLIAASGWNGIGSRGVAPLAKYAAFYFLGDFSDTESSYEAKTLDQMTGTFDIYNYSYGYPGCSFVPAYPSVVSAYRSGVNSLRSGKGAIYVKAAGNEFIGSNSDCDPTVSSTFLGNTNTDEEQNHPYLILVAALNARGKIASYSTPGSGLWISGAGGEFGDDAPAILSTDLTGCHRGFSTSDSEVPGFNSGDSHNPDCDYTSIMNGSSAATPVITGIIALMLETNPALSWRDVKHILAVTAQKINFSTSPIPHPGGSFSSLSGHVYDQNYTVNAAGISFSNTYGFGRADAAAAVSMAKNFGGLGPFLESNWISSGALNLSIPDRSANGTEATISVPSNFVLESVQIKINITHPHVGDLGVELTSPSGTKSRLLLINSNIRQANLSDYTLNTNAFYGERSGGVWRLKVIDGAASDTGSVVSWKIKVNGRAN